MLIKCWLNCCMILQLISLFTLAVYGLIMLHVNKGMLYVHDVASSHAGTVLAWIKLERNVHSHIWKKNWTLNLLTFLNWTFGLMIFKHGTQRPFPANILIKKNICGILNSSGHNYCYNICNITCISMISEINNNLMEGSVYELWIGKNWRVWPQGNDQFKNTGKQVRVPKVDIYIYHHFKQSYKYQPVQIDVQHKHNKGLFQTSWSSWS